MRNQIAETYSYKFDSPFTAWLYQVSMDGCDDEFGSVDEFGCWVGRLGKHMLIEDSNGAVYSIRALKSATTDAMWTWADEYFGADRMAEYFTSNLYSYQATQAHWDALADILGDKDTTALYGPRPELTNTAEYVDGLYSPTGWRDGLRTKSQPVFDDKAPRRAVWLVVMLTAILAVLVPYRAIHRAPRPTSIDPCALVLTREHGPVCR